MKMCVQLYTTEIIEDYLSKITFKMFHLQKGEHKFYTNFINDDK